MKKLLFVLAISMFLFSCSEKKEDNKDDKTKDEQTDEQTGGDESSSGDESGSDSKTDPVGDKSVLDFYNMLPVSKEYKITKKGSKFVTKSNADYEMGVTVDMKNGFIEVNDEGTGGGSITIQVVLFLDDNKGAYIGYSKTAIMDGDINPNASQFEFYTFNDASLNKNTENIIEVMDKNQFVKNGFKPSSNSEVVWDRMGVIYKLPQHGTTVIAELPNKIACGFKGEKAPYPEICNAIKFTKVSYNWDMKTGTFKIGKKQ